jgi:hypothetical protein
MKVPANHNAPMRVPGGAAPQVKPVYLAMAAAHMNSIGKLGPQPPQLDTSLPPAPAASNPLEPTS